VSQSPQYQAHTFRLVRKADHQRTNRSRQPDERGNADLGDHRPASEQNNAADPSRVPLGEAEDPHVADRGADDVCSIEFECVQNALLNVGYERPWPVPPLAVVYRIISNQLHVEAVVDMRRLRERP
jgi:hypothetical protein